MTIVFAKIQKGKKKPNKKKKEKKHKLQKASRSKCRSVELLHSGCVNVYMRINGGVTPSCIHD